MDDRDLQEIYRLLEEILSNRGLNWVNEQVIEQIRLGKTVQREIVTLKQDGPLWYIADEDRFEYKKGPKETFITMENYTPIESLELLLNAIEMVVIDTAENESEMLTSLAKLGEAQEIRFYTDEIESEPNILSAEQSESRLGIGHSLNSLLESLRREIRR